MRSSIDKYPMFCYLAFTESKSNHAMELVNDSGADSSANDSVSRFFN